MITLSIDKDNCDIQMQGEVGMICIEALAIVLTIRESLNRRTPRAGELFRKIVQEQVQEARFWDSGFVAYSPEQGGPAS